MFDLCRTLTSALFMMIQDGFNCGSIHQVSSATLAQIASLTAVTTTLGASCGAVSSLWCSAIISRRQTGLVSFDLSDTLNGCLAGLVSSKFGASSFLSSLFVHSLGYSNLLLVS